MNESIEYNNMYAKLDKLIELKRFIDDEQVFDNIEKIINISKTFGVDEQVQHILDNINDYTNTDNIEIALNQIKNINVSVFVNELNTFDNTKYEYFMIWNKFIIYFHIYNEFNLKFPELSEYEKINNPKYLKQLKMTDENKELIQKSYDNGYKICGLYLSYYIKDKKERLEYCTNLLEQLDIQSDIIEVNKEISKLKKIYKL